LYSTVAVETSLDENYLIAGGGSRYVGVCRRDN
jgi:hypothetical protein